MRVIYNSGWRTTYPKLKRGETMTYQGGEAFSENPGAKGLPALVAMAAAEVIYDSSTPSMTYTSTPAANTYRLDEFSARIIRLLDRREMPFTQAQMTAAGFTPDKTDKLFIVAERWYFKQLPGSLQKRFYFDSLAQTLVFRGLLNDKESGDSDLTAGPDPLNILEPNVLTLSEYTRMKDLSANSTWQTTTKDLFLMAQNPHNVNTVNASETKPVFLSGVRSIPAGLNLATDFYRFYASNGAALPIQTPDALPLDSFGVGSALVTSPELLKRPVTGSLYVTVAENNRSEPSGAPVSLHIIEIVPDRYRGAIKVIEAADAFSEKITLQHNGEFGANTDDLYYEWWIRDAAPLDLIATEILPNGTLKETDAQGHSLWQQYLPADRAALTNEAAKHLGLHSIVFEGRPDIVLADKLVLMRYRHKNEANWKLVPLESTNPVAEWKPGNIAPASPAPFQWAGAANSPQLQANGSKRYIPQLVMGWVKRVLDRINPYEARYTDFFSNESPATYSSQIQIAGPPFAKLAAGKARAGRDIVRGTYRRDYTQDPDGQWQGYTDGADPARAWGVSEWGHRAGQGAFFDWAVANSLLPETAVPLVPGSAPENLDTLERLGAIDEIGEITGGLHEIQLAMDEANGGGNPLGFDADAITFDLDPAASDAGSTHFEQIYSRAVAAGGNALATLDFAAKAGNKLRRIADDTDTLTLEAMRQDLDYRNRLIEIFGRPYAGTIGFGKPYPEGYEGPDTFLFAYLDRTKIDQIVPQTQKASDTTTVHFNRIFSSAKGIMDDATMVTLYSDVWGTSDGKANRKAAFESLIGDSLYQLETPPGVPFTAAYNTASKYGYQALPAWGQRTSYGKVQRALEEMLLTEVGLDQSISDYLAFLKDFENKTRRLQSELKLFKERQALGAQIDAIRTTVNGLFVGIETAIAVYEAISSITGGVADAVAEALPTSIGFSNDVTSIGRGIALAAAVAASEPVQIVKERQLGLWTDGAPQAGQGGLAEILSHLNGNFQVLKGQLGINSPQSETEKISLRSELFRIGPGVAGGGGAASDDRWKDAIKARIEPDLNRVPEFVRYCRPIPGAAVAQPGIVIRFNTSIEPGLNVFGRPLAANDHSYSAANFATKVRGFGVWLDNYNAAGLTTSPRAYLVPVGNDYTRVSTSAQPLTRLWAVQEQRIPTPFTINQSELTSPGFIPTLNGVNGVFAELRRHGDFRMYHDAGGSVDEGELIMDSRLIGRSVWNSEWLLIIPGSGLHLDPLTGLTKLADKVSDIKLYFQTYSHQGQ